MYCPNCGKANNDSQKYCSGCGLSLRASAEVLARELGNQSQERAPVTGRTAGQEGLTEYRRGLLQHPLVYGFSMMMIGILIAVSGAKIFLDKTVSDIGTLLALLGIGLVGFYGVITTVAAEKRRNAPRSLPKSEPAAQLQIVSLPVPASVTENTTKQLDAPPEAVRVDVPAEPARNTQPSLSE